MKYDNKAIAQELIATAKGAAYYGNALKVALDIPCISGSPVHKGTIQEFLNGSYVRFPGARSHLWDAAMLIRDDPNNPEACHRFGFCSISDIKKGTEHENT